MIKWEREKNNIFIKNEIESNMISVKALLLILILLIPISILMYYNFFGEEIELLVILVILMFILSVSISLVLFFKINKWWIKYLLVTILAIFGGVFSLYSDGVMIVWISALVLSSLYFSKGLTWYSFILLMIVQASSAIVAEKIHTQVNGQHWYVPALSLGMEMLIIFPVFLSIVNLTESRIKKIARSEKEQALLLEKMSSVVNRTSAAAKYVSVEIKHNISIVDKSKSTNETMNQMASQISEKAEYNTQDINNAYSTIQNISQKLNKTSSDLEKIADMSTKAVEIKHHVKGFIDSATEQMMSISKNKQESKNLIYKVGKRSLEVKRIVEIISSIARDTKLVAFNAQVESAKAGIQGRGFAVIAVEVVKLAELNKQAATEITELANNIQGLSEKAIKNIDSGSQMIDRGLGSFNTLNAIFSSFSEVSDEKQRQIQDLSSESKKIAKAAFEIVQRVEKIRDVNQRGSADFKDVKSLADEQYNIMKEIISVVGEWESLSDKLTAITNE